MKELKQIQVWCRAAKDTNLTSEESLKDEKKRIENALEYQFFESIITSDVLLDAELVDVKLREIHVYDDILVDLMSKFLDLEETGDLLICGNTLIMRLELILGLIDMIFSSIGSHYFILCEITYRK